MKFYISFFLLFLLCAVGKSQVRIVSVVPSSNTITIKNFGASTVDISAYRLCALIKYTSNLTTDITINSGNLNLTAGSEVEIIAPGGASSTWVDLQTESDLGLYLASGSFSSASAMVDFVQWGSGGHGRESVADTKGIWTAGEFVSGTEPYSYTGNGSNDGSSFWQGISNSSPTDIVLNNTSIDENQSVNSLVGVLSSIDDDASDEHTYALMAGSGDTDNSSFLINGDRLESNEMFDFETSDNYSVRISTDDGNGGTFEKSFAITIENNNDKPSNIDLSVSSVTENLSISTVIGSLTSDDQDAADVHSYILSVGTGDTDNVSFSINDNNLESNEIYNFELKNSYSIRVQSNDNNGGTYDEIFVISISDANDSPSGIILSNSTLFEKAPIGTSIGTFSTTDEDTNDIHTYALTSGTGDTDNASFEIENNTLKSVEIFDFAIKSTYSVRVQVNDGNGGFMELIFEITILEDGTKISPSNIGLNNNTIDENMSAATVIGTLSTTDQNIDDVHTYSFVEGTGDTDNDSFLINGENIESAEIFNYEVKSSYSVRIQTDDGSGGILSKSFTISVNNINDVPTTIDLDNLSINENEALGAIVGTFTTIDEDVDDNHEYTLVSGVGDEDNVSFAIVNEILKTNSLFDFSTKSSYSILVRATDSGNSSIDKNFILSIIGTDENSAPTDISLNSTLITENEAVGTVVGTLTAQDSNINDQHSFLLIAGEGDSDNSSFLITGNSLITNQKINYEEKNTCSIRIVTDDGNGGTFEKFFEITITNVNESPTGITLSNESIDENLGSGIIVGNLVTIDEDKDDFHLYSLVSGAGDSDNANFSINNSSIETLASFNFENKSTYSIRVKTIDNGSNSFEQTFVIVINNINDPPTEINYTPVTLTSIDPTGTLAACFTTIDEDTNDQHSYSLVDGDGSDHNLLFVITEIDLITNSAIIDLDVSTLKVRIRSADNEGAFIEAQFGIPLEIITSLTRIDRDLTLNIYPNPFNDQIDFNYLFDNTNLRLIIYDLQGMVVGEKRLLPASENSFKIKTSELKPGKYFFRIIDKDKTIASFTAIKQ